MEKERTNLQIVDLEINGPCDHPARLYPNVNYTALLYSESGRIAMTVKFRAKVQFDCKQVRWFFNKYKSQL